MKFYRLSKRSEPLGHQGYEFFTSMTKAEAAGKEFLDSMDDEHEPSYVISPIEIKPTKAGILG